MAVFLDRPLGVFKDAGHVDRTPLVSYAAFSRRIAAARLAQLDSWGLLNANDVERCVAALDRVSPAGSPASALPGRQTTGVVTLEDAVRAAPDFVFTRTTRRSLDDLLAGYDLTALAEQAGEAHRWLTNSADVLLIRTAGRESAQRGSDFLTALDRQLRPRLTLALARPGAPAYVEARGIELLRDGLRATQIGQRSSDLRLRANY